MPILLAIVLMLAVMLGIPGCYIVSSSNTFERRDEQVKLAWTGILTAYKNRADTLPALQEITKGAAGHDVNVNVKYAEARSTANKVQIPENASPEDLQKFLAAQRELGAGIGRLLAVAEAQPNIKADKNFQDLQQKVSDFNQQIMANQRRYTREVAAFNVNVRTWPSKLIADYKGVKLKPQLAFDDEQEIKKMPTMSFGGKS